MLTGESLLSIIRQEECFQNDKMASNGFKWAREWAQMELNWASNGAKMDPNGAQMDSRVGLNEL